MDLIRKIRRWKYTIWLVLIAVPMIAIAVWWQYNLLMLVLRG